MKMQTELMVVKRDFEPDEIITEKDFGIMLENYLETLDTNRLPYDLGDAWTMLEEEFYVEFTIPDAWCAELEAFVDNYRKERQRDERQASSHYEEDHRREDYESWKGEA